MKPRWLRLKSACEYSAIGKDRLIKLAKDGVVVGYQDPDNARGDWIFDRLSLDGYRVAQMDNTRRKGIAILRSL